MAGWRKKAEAPKAEAPKEEASPVAPAPVLIPDPPPAPAAPPPPPPPAPVVFEPCTRCKVAHDVRLVQDGPQGTRLCPTCWREVAGGRDPFVA